MRKALTLLLALAMLAAACGDDDGGGSIDPSSANTCEDLADVSINLMQDAIDAVSDLSISDFMDMAEADEMPEAFARLDVAGEQLETRAEQLGCTEEQAQELVCGRLDDLKADSDVAKLILAGITSEC